MDDNQILELTHKYGAEHREAEIVWFYKVCENINPEIIVEIGIRRGGTLRVLSSMLNSEGIVINIDMQDDIVWDQMDYPCNAFRINGSSFDKNIVTKLKKCLKGKKIDVLFIDGEHSYENVMQDYKIFSNLVRSGGIIAVHDIYYLDEVARAWKDIPSEHKYESIWNQSSIGIGYIVKD